MGGNSIFLNGYGYFQTRLPHQRQVIQKHIAALALVEAYILLYVVVPYMT